MTVMAAAPVALAVVTPRTPRRDVALFFLHMWAYLVAHELPYDDPERLRRRLRIRYPIVVDRALGAGTLPNARLQKWLSRPEGRTLDTVLTWTHWLWFLEPYAALLWIRSRDERRFARGARQMGACFDLGALTYAAVPTAPPWWASEEGHTDEAVRRLMVEQGERTWGGAWPVLYGFFGGNPWAAMPSVHFGTSVMAAVLLGEVGPAERAAGWAYATTLGFALVYLGEHYVIDLVAGASVVAAVRTADRAAEPLGHALSARIQRLERLAGTRRLRFRPGSM